MSDGFLSALALLVAVAAMLSFALSIGAHWRQIAGERPHPLALRVGLRLMGAALLFASFSLCVDADPVTMAILVLPMLLTVAAAVVAAALLLRAAFEAGSRRKGEKAGG